ncbi:MAG: hypothetical protein ACRD0H_24510, partial [Actinomycetes bacterium]
MIVLIVAQLAAMGAAGNATAAETTVAARPDGDVRSEWRVAGSAAPPSASAAVDDPVTQPTSVTAADYLYAGAAGKVTEVRVADLPLGHQVATAARGWFYANTGATTRLQVDLVWQGTVRASTIVPVSSGFAWRSLTASPPDQAAVNDVRLRFTALGGGDSNVRAAYVDFATRDCSTTAPGYGGYGPFGSSAWPAACWNPYAAASPFNRPLPPDVATRIRTDSPQIVGHVLGDISVNNLPGHLIADDDGTSGEPTYYSRPGDPTFFIRCVIFTPCPISPTTRIRIPAGAVPEGGVTARPIDDRHMTIIDQESGIEYDFWKVELTAPIPAQPTPAQSTINVGFAGVTRIDGPGHDGDGAVDGDATAAHFGSLAGRIRAEELAAGSIDHALSISIACSSGTSVYPVPTGPKGTPCTQTQNAPPLGSLFWLQMTPAEIAAQQIPDWQKTILRAMATYGMYFGETGSRFYFNIETEAGNQYTSLGGTDRWTDFARAAGWQHKPAASDYP